jgi:DNA-binding NtrC family response regulator
MKEHNSGETLRLQLGLFAARVLDSGLTLEEGSQALEREVITQSLNQGVSIVGAAKRLGIHRNTLTRKMQELEVRKPKKSELKKLPTAAPAKREWESPGVMKPAKTA